jgi:hypothetical protein
MWGKKDKEEERSNTLKKLSISKLGNMIHLLEI